MSMRQPKQDATLEDILSLPDGVRAELIDGIRYDLAAPGRVHQQLLMNLSGAIFQHLQTHPGKCEVYPAPFAVFLNHDDRTYVEPDISVICHPERLEEDGCHGAPDWIIEIVSPFSRQMDYLIKSNLYHTAGVRLYWIVDPQEKLVTVYWFEKGEITHFHFGESIPVDLDPTLILTVQL